MQFHIIIEGGFTDSSGYWAETLRALARLPESTATIAGQKAPTPAAQTSLAHWPTARRQVEAPSGARVIRFLRPQADTSPSVDIPASHYSVLPPELADARLRAREPGLGTLLSPYTKAELGFAQSDRSAPAIQLLAATTLHHAILSKSASRSPIALLLDSSLEKTDATAYTILLQLAQILDLAIWQPAVSSASDFPGHKHNRWIVAIGNPAAAHSAAAACAARGIHPLLHCTGPDTLLRALSLGTADPTTSSLRSLGRKLIGERTRSGPVHVVPLQPALLPGGEAARLSFLLREPSAHPGEDPGFLFPFDNAAGSTAATAPELARTYLAQLSPFFDVAYPINACLRHLALLRTGLEGHEGPVAGATAIELQELLAPGESLDAATEQLLANNSSPSSLLGLARPLGRRRAPHLIRRVCAALPEPDRTRFAMASLQTLLNATAALYDPTTLSRHTAIYAEAQQIAESAAADNNGADQVANMLRALILAIRHEPDAALQLIGRKQSAPVSDLPYATLLACHLWLLGFTKQARQAAECDDGITFATPFALWIRGTVLALVARAGESVPFWESLVTRQPDFFAKNRASSSVFLFLHASALACAGDLQQADRFLSLVRDLDPLARLKIDLLHERLIQRDVSLHVALPRLAPDSPVYEYATADWPLRYLA